MKVLTFSFKFSPVGHGKTLTNALLHHAFPRRHQLLFAYDYRYVLIDKFHSSIDGNSNTRFFLTENNILSTIRKLFRFVIPKNGEKKWTGLVVLDGGLLTRISDFSFHLGLRLLIIIAQIFQNFHFVVLSQFTRILRRW